MIIAVDGPAASGKGTLSRQLADHYQLPYLDTGLLYRGVALAVLAKAGSCDDAKAAEAAARSLSVSSLDPEKLAVPDVGEGASRVAAIPSVRKVLKNVQVEFANQPGGAVLDGRDIGTVICPGADVKLFVTAKSEIRAERRSLQFEQKGRKVDRKGVLADIVRRDQRDAGRPQAPMKMAADAHLLDTTELDIEAAFHAAVAIIDGTIEKEVAQ